ncbi:MAG: hypothetical protein IPJ33_04505 [Gammaproteobacteria bacterium]|nr:hypothetical protein [Gammaproteobacteria bacterium]
MKPAAMFAIVLVAVATCACTKREHIELHDGFAVIRIYGDVRSLMRPNGRELIMPNVVEAVDDHTYIIGRRVIATPATDLPDGFRDQPYGYFVFKKDSEELRMGLTYDQLISIVDSEGIQLTLEPRNK